MQAWTWAPEDLSLTIRFLRALRGWTQTRLAREAGTDKSRISLLEAGKLTPSRKEMERFAAAVGFPVYLLEICIPMLRSCRLVLPPETSTPTRGKDGKEITERVEAVTEKLATVARTKGLQMVAELLLAEEEPRWSYQEEDRAEAGELYRLLETCSQEERLYAIEEGVEYRSWALAERLCDESEKAVAAADAAKALELAEAALKVAGSLEGPEAWCAHVQGYCRGFLAHALKAAGRPDEAEQAYATARRLWRHWVPDPDLLQESRLVRLGEGLRAARRPS